MSAMIAMMPTRSSMITASFPWPNKNQRKPKENNTFLTSRRRAQQPMSKTQRFLILLGEVNFRIALKMLPLSSRSLTFLALVKINGRCSKNASSKKWTNGLRVRPSLWKLKTEVSKTYYFLMTLCCDLGPKFEKVDQRRESETTRNKKWANRLDVSGGPLCTPFRVYVLGF